MKTPTRKKLVPVLRSMGVRFQSFHPQNSQDLQILLVRLTALGARRMLLIATKSFAGLVVDVLAQSTIKDFLQCISRTKKQRFSENRAVHDRQRTLNGKKLPTQNGDLST